MRPEIIIMLTHHDVTVKNAAEVFEECKDIEAVKLWGFKNVGLPKDQMKTLTADQLSAFFQEAKDSGVFELYYLELATGLRRGELLGLKWEDIDLERGDLRVKRQVARINGEVVEAPLKTKNAYRTLPLSADAIDVLMQQRKKRVTANGCSRHPPAAPCRRTACCTCCTES